jgi:hypothetical protein
MGPSSVNDLYSKSIILRQKAATRYFIGPIAPHECTVGKINLSVTQKISQTASRRFTAICGSISSQSVVNQWSCTDSSNA